MDRRDLRLSASAAARKFALIGAAFVAGLFASSLPARAQTLQRLHVRAFSMSADTLTPSVGQAFRLTISAHVDEQVSELDNVTLPDLSQFEVEGDERRCTATVKGSDCSETVTLVPSVKGDRTIASATMDALDASDKKPSRFATNSLRLQIGGPPLSFGPIDDSISSLFWSTVRSFLILIAVVIALWFVLWRFARPRPLVPAAAPVASVPPPPVPAPVDDFDAYYRSLVEALRVEPTRARAFAVRHALRYALGAQDKETLLDLRARNAAGDRPKLLTALGAIERAVFCEDDRVELTAREALPFLTI